MPTHFPMNFRISLLFIISSVPLFAQSSEIVEEKVTIYSSEVYFDFALFDIRLDADSTLRAVFDYLQNIEESYSVKITAHTDYVGSKGRNMVLSQNRANAVKDYLSVKGISEALMEATVFGEDQPQATNKTDQGRQLNRRATIDVFQVKKMYPLTAQIIDEESGKPIRAEVIIRTKDSRDSLRTDEAGMIRLPVPLNAVIGIDIYSECYFFRTKMLRANPKNLADLKFKLKKAKAGMAVDINNLYFVGNKDTLLRKSEPELPKILKFMQMSECLKIQIAGHINLPNTPKVAKNTGHFDLSRRRARMVFEYLVENGISEDRVEYQGYGNWEMRYPKARAEKEQALNRRVEIRILEGDKEETCLCELL